MIVSRADVINLFKEYLETEHEWTAMFWGREPEWSVKRQVFYSNGVVFGKYREADQPTLAALAQGVADGALQREICIYLRDRIKGYQSLDDLDILQQACYEEKLTEYEDIKNIGVDKWIDRYCMWIAQNENGLSGSRLRTLFYLYYGFENYKRELNNPYNSDLSVLEAAYDGVFDKQSQFARYGLVPVDATREILAIDPPRMYDRGLDKTFFIKNVPLHLLERLLFLRENGYIGEMAVRLKNEKCYEGKLSSEYLAEALERGKYFSLADLSKYSVTKLYSKQYEDCLWIVTDSGNITFEELCEDFDIYEDTIVTQVVHLSYVVEGRNAYITHLDHEYIFYSAEEYERRMVDETQKGKAKSRMKSFKIDHARIPFDYELEIRRKDENGAQLPVEHEQFLSYILETYFKHKDLLKEYFQAE